MIMSKTTMPMIDSKMAFSLRRRGLDLLRCPQGSGAFRACPALSG